MGLLSSDDSDGDTEAGFEHVAELPTYSSAYRVIDEEAGVVIWAVRDKTSGYGLTALPIEETDLELPTDSDADVE